MFSNPPFFLTKLPLFLLYLRPIAVTLWFRYAIYFGIAACAVFYAAAIIAYSVPCIVRPGETWLQVRSSSYCLQEGIPVTYMEGIFGLLSDIYLFMLPIPVILSLHLSLRKRLGVISIFATGLL